MTHGTKLGPYEIVALIGAGGMGEVYRAHDSKLKRDVALKVLPDAVANDPERLVRFAREAQVLASLNHPNIAQVYGVEDRALVMELVEGESPKGPMPFDEAWKIASQIADALEYAHEKGIVHRDLKPANVKVTPEGVVKLLDFGLAKAFRGETVAPVDSENSPTLTLGGTQLGVIMGTAAYMSPEQARGKSVDKRADIWAFGVVLYELITGKRLFQGEDVSHTMAAVIMQEPQFDGIPVPVQRLLKSCLEKNPKKRLRDIGDVSRLLEAASSPDADATKVLPQAKARVVWLWAAAGILAISLAGVSWALWRSTRSVDHPLVRLSVDLGPNAVASARITAAISPDGTRIVFPVRGPGGTQLATRLLNQATSTLLPGTENASDPFFKPDGQWIGFNADGKLKKISVLGGAAITICDAPNLRGASWGEDDHIIFTPGLAGGLWRVAGAGGKPEPLTQPTSKGEQAHRWPQILPGGKAVLFTGNTSSMGFENASIEVLSLQTGQTKVVQQGGYFGRYVAETGSRGHLVYLHEGVLFGVPFDLDKLEPRGTPAPLLQDVASEPTSGGGQLDCSRTGTLVYRSGKSTGATYPVVWLDSSGKTQPLVVTLGEYLTPRFSPDGTRLALAIRSGKGIDIYVYDLGQEFLSHLTLNGQFNSNPVWTPDGKHIVFRSAATSDSSNIWWIRSDGAGEAQLLYQGKGQAVPYSFSPDGHRLAFVDFSPETILDIWTMLLDLTDPEHPKPGTPEKFWASPKSDVAPMFSPDGRWMAYASDEPGQLQVFVRPFPRGPGVWQISTEGGSYPFWSRDGKLFYIGAKDRIFAVDYTARGDTFRAEKPRLWSDVQIRPSAGGPSMTPLDLAPDGKRFAIFPVPQTEEEKGSVHVTFLFNFFDELRRQIPVGK